MPPPDTQRLTSDGLTVASNRKLLELTKILGVEQNILARQLGVSRSAVSFWATDQRPIPAKYRAGLLTWTRVALDHARDRAAKEVQALPTAARQVEAIEAFEAPITHWWITVLYEAGEVKSSARKNARWLLDLLHQDSWTPSDLEQMQSLWEVLGTKITILHEMARSEEARTTVEQDTTT